MDAECERVVVRRRDGGSCCCTNMREDDFRRGVGADGAKVRVVEGRLDGLVERRVEDWAAGLGGLGRVGCEGWCVPHHAKAIYIEEAVPRGDFGFSCGLGVDGGVVGEEFWEVVLVDLLAEGVGGC